MTIDDLTIGEAKELSALFGNATTTPRVLFKYTGEFRIVVLQFGWVFVGALHTLPSGEIELRGARNVRRWGTSKGIGELKNGPLSDTTFEPSEDIIFNPAALVFTIETEAKQWL